MIEPAPEEYFNKSMRPHVLPVLNVLGCSKLSDANYYAASLFWLPNLFQPLLKLPVKLKAKNFCNPKKAVIVLTEIFVLVS